MFEGLLTITVFLPAPVAILVTLFARGKEVDRQVRWISIAASAVTFALTVMVYVGYDQAVGGIQMVDYYERWIPVDACLLYTSPSPRDGLLSRMPSSA